MARYLVLFLALLVSGVMGCTSIVDPPVRFAVTAPTPDVAGLISKTVALVGDGGAYCSGVWVSDTTIVTANHCVAESAIGEPVEYVVRDDVYANGELEASDTISARASTLYARDADHDLVLLHAPQAPAHLNAPVSTGAVRAGQRVSAMGMPLGEWFSYSSGDVAALRYLNSHGHVILFVQATTPISGGSSGGGLFDEFGELVGITHATFTNGQNMNLFIHYQYVHDLLVKSGF